MIRVNIAGGFAAAQLTSAHVEANGIRLPTKRRAYTRDRIAGPSRTGPLGRPSDAEGAAHDHD